MRQLFRLKGINWWLLTSAMGLNFIWAMLMLFAGTYLLSQDSGQNSLLQLGMLLVCFILPFLVAWMVSALAGDALNLSYGLYGSAGAAVPILIVVTPSGMLGIILGAMTLLGGLNGAMFALRRSRSR